VRALVRAFVCVRVGARTATRENMVQALVSTHLVCAFVAHMQVCAQVCALVRA
jgi:hypothetical protein